MWAKFLVQYTTKPNKLLIKIYLSEKKMCSDECDHVLHFQNKKKSNFFSNMNKIHQNSKMFCLKCAFNWNLVENKSKNEKK